MNEKVKHFIFNFLTSEYGNLIKYESEEHENYLFYFLGNEKIIIHIIKNDEILIRWSIVWKFLEAFFDLNEHEIKLILLEWVETNYDIKVSKINSFNDYQFNWIYYDTETNVLNKLSPLVFP